MAWMIGIDEAGYGPNLGPLVVAATAWRVAEDPGFRIQHSGNRSRTMLAPSAPSFAPPVDLYARLASIISAEPDEDLIAIADSKLLYKQGNGLRLLERGVLTGVSALGPPRSAAARWQLLWNCTNADPRGLRHALPWYANFDCPLPINAELDELANLRTEFHSACSEANVELFDIRVRTVFPREFNELTNHYGTKGAALSHVSIGLLREVIDHLLESCVSDSSWPSPLAGDTHVTCDKHGGRSRYAALLQHHFPNQWIETIDESRAASRYQWGPPEAQTKVCFRTRGEAELPTALASMTAKYHRELAMRAFNQFWCARVPGLRPTAGYPVDAKRFKADIATAQRQLGIEDRDLWRNR